MLPIARHQVSFTASFMIEVNEIRNRYLKLERQSHCLGGFLLPLHWAPSRPAQSGSVGKGFDQRQGL